MIDYQTLRLVHPHGNEWAEMRREHHDPADHDVERQWGKNARIFKCVSCEERVVVIPPEDFEPEER